MIIPYFNYEISFTISNKTYFCVFLMMLFLIIANPGTYKIVGDIIGLDGYDDTRSYHRFYLLFIHAIIYGGIIYVVLSIYNPFSPSSSKPKIPHPRIA